MTFDRDYQGYRFYVEPIGDNLADTMAMWQAHWDEQREETLRAGAQFNPAVEEFRRLEAIGAFSYITVRQGEELAGHFGIHFNTNKQTSQRAAGDDFFYLKPEHRKGFLAAKLIKFARDYAFNAGAEEFTVSFRTTVDDLGPLMTRCGMKRIAHVYSVRR